jgi:EAL domain-containing protein (putative c-di-GMP-specific phosphodiesterase class I)
LQLKEIDEGVETENQKQILLDSGCQRFQGYLFGKPLPVDEFEVLIATSFIIN